MLACRCLNASANPPARLGFPPLSGVALPLLPPVLPILIALSLGAGGGAGFLPAGRFVGGAGGVGFARAVGIGRDVPFRVLPLAADDGGG